MKALAQPWLAAWAREGLGWGAVTVVAVAPAAAALPEVAAARKPHCESL